MAYVYMTIKITGKARSVKLKKLLVDTGAWYTFVAPSTIKKISPIYLGESEIELGNKSLINAKVYSASISYKQRTFKFAQVASFPGVTEAVGAQTLEGLGLWIDPRKKKLISTRKRNVMYYH